MLHTTGQVFSSRFSYKILSLGWWCPQVSEVGDFLAGIYIFFLLPLIFFFSFYFFVLPYSLDFLPLKNQESFQETLFLLCFLKSVTSNHFLYSSPSCSPFENPKECPIKPCGGLKHKTHLTQTCNSLFHLILNWNLSQNWSSTCFQTCSTLKLISTSCFDSKTFIYTCDWTLILSFMFEIKKTNSLILFTSGSSKRP